jgi:hypothetical protein
VNTQSKWYSILSLDLNHIPGEKYLVYSSTLMAYYNYLVLVGMPACMYSQYVHMHLILYLKEKQKNKKKHTKLMVLNEAAFHSTLQGTGSRLLNDGLCFTQQPSSFSQFELSLASNKSVLKDIGFQCVKIFGN